MKRILFLFVALCGLTLSAQTVTHYGYAPDTLLVEELRALGAGENGFMAGMICLDPAVDPVVKRLKGKQVKGVRCYLRADYQQKRKKWSYVMHTTGAVDAEPTKLYCDFNEGWNEVYFDTPVTIGDDKLFIGYEVYELRGTPWPLVCYGKATVPGGCWINAKHEGWVENKGQGTLLIQAILEDEAAPLLANTVYAQVAETPLTVKPATLFPAGVYVLNHTNQPVSTIELATQGQGDTDVHMQTVTFDTPIAPYSARFHNMQIRSGAESGANQWLKVNVTKVDGVEAQEAFCTNTSLYITEDAFSRIPLVEEFTSQACINCPFMIYYLDKAIEEFGAPVLYVTHHSGFKKDAFSLPVDEELLYLFGEEGTSNPAVMYDRRVAVGDINPVVGASEASTTPYTNALTEASMHPAMAEVLVDVVEENGTIAPHVHGRINREMAASGDVLYLTTYLVEDSISVEDYPQLGLDEDGAPEDIMERFRHNGVKRHVFNTVGLGDVLTLDANNDFSVEYPAVAFDSKWNKKNCHVVAFVHKMDKENMAGNEVLNAGSSKFNSVVNGIDAVRSGATYDVRFSVGGDGVLRPNLPIKQLHVYDVAGKQVGTRGALRSGVYVVRYTLPNGVQGAQKLMVK